MTSTRPAPSWSSWVTAPRPHSRAAVAPPVLLGRCHLGDRPPHLGDQEHRVVAEAGGARPRLDDLAPALAVEDPGRPARQGQGDRAGEPRPPWSRDPRQAAEQQAVALVLRGGDAG